MTGAPATTARGRRPAACAVRGAVGVGSLGSSMTRSVSWATAWRSARGTPKRAARSSTPGRATRPRLRLQPAPVGRSRSDGYAAGVRPRQSSWTMAAHRQGVKASGDDARAKSRAILKQADRPEPVEQHLERESALQARERSAGKRRHKPAGFATDRDGLHLQLRTPPGRTAPRIAALALALLPQSLSSTTWVRHDPRETTRRAGRDRYPRSHLVLPRCECDW